MKQDSFDFPPLLEHHDNDKLGVWGATLQLLWIFRVKLDVVVQLHNNKLSSTQQKWITEHISKLKLVD